MPLVRHTLEGVQTQADQESLLNLKGRACTDIKREVQLDLGVLAGVIMDGLDTVFRHSTNRTRSIVLCDGRDLHPV